MKQEKTNFTVIIRHYRAFNNILKKRHIHNLYVKEIDKQIVILIYSFLIWRPTIFCTNKYIMEKIDIFTRISQRLLLLPILFSFDKLPFHENLEKIRPVLAIGL